MKTYSEEIVGLEEDIKQGRKFKNQYEKLIVNLIYTNSWLSEQQKNIFKPFGISSAQYNVLRILRGHFPKPCTINAIIDRMIDRMSNASRIVDRLEAKGLVERTVSETDRRAKDVLITQKGLDLLAEVEVNTREWMERFKKIADERVNETNDFLDELRSI
ncbi:MarR family winged helix-turn-helix transcriptional regulator [Roseivirga echinicomitans]